MVLDAEPVRLRAFRPGDEPALHAVFHSAIHDVASRDYDAAQIAAWAPADVDPERWARRMQGIRPFVAEISPRIVGYADLQEDGYIDHFFVSGTYPRRGVGRLLMTRILETARERGLAELRSDVSRTAQPFFARFGFRVVEQRTPEIGGVVVPNARMCRDMQADPTQTGGGEST